MTTGTHRCNCGQHFGLKVELAYHCQLVGHTPLVPLSPANPGPAPRRRWLTGRILRPLLAACMLASMISVNCLMERAIREGTAAQARYTSQVVVVP